MRTLGTKYETIAILPEGAMPVSVYARHEGYSSPAYVHVKYDRHKFGYLAHDKVTLKHSDYPGYDIYCYEGMNYVVEKKSQKISH